MSFEISPVGTTCVTVSTRSHTPSGPGRCEFDREAVVRPTVTSRHRVAVQASDPLVHEGLLVYLGVCEQITLVDSKHSDADVLVVAGPDAAPDGKTPLAGGRRHDVVPTIRITGVAHSGRFSGRGRPWATVLMPLVLADRERVVRCVVALARGDLGSVASESGADLRKDRWTGRDVIELASPETFSERELRVLRLLADGFEGPKIAADLGCSARQANYIIQGAVDRLGAINRLQAVGMAICRGLI
jgi:DNA-binding CsgD family transcriptional regulator